MKILYVGPLWNGSTSLQKALALMDLGHEVVRVDTETDLVREKKAHFMNRVKMKLFGPSDVGNINGKILGLIHREKFDVLWVDKGLTIESGTIMEFKRLCPEAKAVTFSPDDMMNPDNQSRQYLGAISAYDLHVTTKSFNVSELENLGAKDVYYTDKSFSRRVHRPVPVSDTEKAFLGGSVGFIGTYEKERAKSINFLAKNGISVKVWGRWPRHCVFGGSVKGVEIMGKPLWGDDYAKAICSFDINLGFLRKCNRDLQTCRSVEIPACGSFMLAERTEEHLRLFKEGVDAEFFCDDAELLKKTRYYLTHPMERALIARAGYERCMESGYDNQSKLAGIFGHIFG